MTNKLISEFDLVQVVELNQNVPEAKIGDIATVVMLFSENKKTTAYEIECVLKNGQTKWQGAFKEHQQIPYESPSK